MINGKGSSSKLMILVMVIYPVMSASIGLILYLVFGNHPMINYVIASIIAFGVPMLVILLEKSSAIGAVHEWWKKPHPGPWARFFRTLGKILSWFFEWVYQVYDLIGVGIVPIMVISIPVIIVLSSSSIEPVVLGVIMAIYVLLLMVRFMDSLISISTGSPGLGFQSSFVVYAALTFCLAFLAVMLIAFPDHLKAISKSEILVKTLGYSLGIYIAIAFINGLWMFAAEDIYEWRVQSWRKKINESIGLPEDKIELIDQIILAYESQRPKRVNFMFSFDERTKWRRQYAKKARR